MLVGGYVLKANLFQFKIFDSRGHEEKVKIKVSVKVEEHLDRKK